MPKHARWFCQFTKQAVAKKRSLSKMKHGCTYIPLQEVRKVSKSVHTPIPATVTTGIITVFYWIPMHLQYIKTDISVHVSLHTHTHIYIYISYMLTCHKHIYIYTYTCGCVSKLWYHCVYITMYVYCVCCIPSSQTSSRNQHLLHHFLAAEVLPEPSRKVHGCTFCCKFRSQEPMSNLRL